MRLVILAGVLIAGPAIAAPPPVGSDDWNIMAPYAKWVTTQHDSIGRWCCDIGDGRPVDARIHDDHWEAHITRDHFPDEPERWVVVPDSKINKEGNPTGSAIIWVLPDLDCTATGPMYSPSSCKPSGRPGVVQCFAPPSGV